MVSDKWQDAEAAATAGTVSFAVRTEHHLYGFRPRRTAPAASVLKAMLMVAYLRWPEVRGRPLLVGTGLQRVAGQRELALAQAVIYLAVAAKSNAVYQAYNAARDFVSADGTRPVPLHIRNAPTRLMKDLGYGKGYRYAHDEPDAYSAGQSYFPEGMPAVEWYQPTERGLEAKIREKITELKNKK